MPHKSDIFLMNTNLFHRNLLVDKKFDQPYNVLVIKLAE